MQYVLIFILGSWFGFGVAAVLSANKSKKE